MFFVRILVQAHILQIYTLLFIYIGEYLPQFPALFSYGMWRPIPFNVRFQN